MEGRMKYAMPYLPAAQGECDREGVFAIEDRLNLISEKPKEGDSRVQIWR
ncbi:Hypothetical predicted protein [Pelobates cultripes]|uniref:Uncharacterized protein n=1 Tax=Pelobates cultripes TaxID=61616 RepID=A0AAD1VJX7_PELCU|nr:Hypothetical predicted protein [Pelobates cultripes]